MSDGSEEAATFDTTDYMSARLGALVSAALTLEDIQDAAARKIVTDAMEFVAVSPRPAGPIARVLTLATDAKT